MAFCVFLFIKGPKYQGPRRKFVTPALVAVPFLLLPVTTEAAQNTNVLASYFANIAQGYENYGFVYGFSSRQGKTEIVADLSKKQGSASNGEKQTPYFIILAASLIQYYPRQVCCARLAFIDEAFSALSRERIEQMVKYFEENHFQVFYAAPPEKINSIGSFIESTVSLVTSGRYTHAVEGLVQS